MPRKLSDFRLASQEEIESVGYGGAGIFTGAPGGFHRTIIYKLMNETFGPPNTYAGDKSTWEWIIYTNAGLLTIYDYKGDWSIGYASTNLKLSIELLNEASALQDALLIEADKIHFSKMQIQKLKVGGAILNPYSLYRNTTEDLIRQTSEIIKEIESLQKERDINKTLDSFAKSQFVSSLNRSAFMTTFLSLEGFINLVYTLFLKNRYRNDIYDKRLRNEMLPIKILEMDVYCHSFKSSPLEKNGELFGAIQHFINTRNLILHANISDAMEEHIIKQDTNLLVLKRKEEKEKYGIASDIMNLNNVNVIRANKLVQKFVAKVLQSLAEDVKIPFTMVHSNLWVEYRHEEPDSIFFPLSEDDYVPLKEIRSILKESTELDEDYYNISEKKF
ncbi:MAG: hypothetical protein O8C65_01930 [Candidatus Methanoperedens sp.]|nr:hypothetical protein [Candidatus Methanoperedens sp.]